MAATNKTIPTHRIQTSWFSSTVTSLPPPEASPRGSLTGGLDGLQGSSSVVLPGAGERKLAAVGAVV
jgi:hypothetical protein